MTTLVIPDIHLRQGKIQRILENFPHDKAVFLGDVFDDYGDSVAQNVAAAAWLREILESPKNIVLWGNHDIQYRWPLNRHLRCRSERESASKYQINEVLPDEIWDAAKFFHEEQGFLISHAGLKYQLYKDLLEEWHNAGQNTLKAVVENLNDWLPYAYELLESGESHPLFAAGRSRKGREPHGGLTWCCWGEFFPIPNVNQILGHTTRHVPELLRADGGKISIIPFSSIEAERHETINVNLDCSGAWFGSITDGKLSTHLTLDYLTPETG